MQLKNEFYNKYFPNSSESTIKWNDSFINSFEEMTKGEDIKDALSNQKIVTNAFSMSSASCVSFPSYNRIAKILKCLIDFYGIKDVIIPSRNDISTASTTQLFKNLDEALDIIDKAGIDKIESYDRNTDLVHIKAIATLVWYGFSEIEIINLLKKSLVKDNDVCSIKTEEDKVVYIPKKYFTILEDFSRTDYVKSLSGKTSYYVGRDQYLFRAIRKSNTVGERLITQKLQLFNIAMPKYLTKKITMYSLKLSGKFESVYNNESNETNIIKRIMKALDCDQIIAKRYLIPYKTWIAELKERN